MTKKSVESIPGFLGWFTEGQVPTGAFTLQYWGVRRIASFDSEEACQEALVVDVPTEYDPIQEMRIEVFTYYEVKADVEGLHLHPHELTRRAYELLDPYDRLSHMMLSRMSRVFASREEAAALAAKLQFLGLRCEISEREDYLTPGMICEDPNTVHREVERRRASGGALHRIALPEGLHTILERYDI